MYLFLISLSALAQDKSKICIVDAITKMQVEYVQVYSLCYPNDVIFSDEKGIINKNHFSQFCEKYELSHLNYKDLQINSQEFSYADTLWLTPIKYDFDEITITSQKLDNQYLYDLINDFLDLMRKNKINSTRYYYFVLNSKTDKELRENVSATLKLDYNHQNGFKRKVNAFVEGSFRYNREAIFLNLETDKLITSFSPFSITQDEYCLPLNVKKITKRNHLIKRLICDNCKESEYLFQISSMQDGKIATIKFDYISLKAIEYQVIVSEFLAVRLLGLKTNEARYLEDFKIKYTFNETGDFIDLIEFVFNVRIGESNKTKVLGILKNNKQSRLPTHFITGKYNPDNIYEEIALSISDSVCNRYSFNDDLAKGIGINESDYYKLSSANPQILSLFLSLPNSKNKFLVHGQQKINSSNYKMFLLEKEYWYYKYEKKIFNNSFLNFNWVINYKTEDSIKWRLDSKPTFWNSNYSNIYATYIDTIHFNFFSNVIFDWVEAQRLKFISSFDNNIYLRDIANISNNIDSTFNFVNNSAQNLLFKFIDEKMSFEEVDRLNSEIKGILGIDNLHLYFKTEIPRIIQDNKYESTIGRYLNLGYKLEHKDSTYFKYCIERSIILLDELIKSYEAIPSRDLKKLGSYYGLQAESYMLLKDIKPACECLNYYIKYWPGTIEYSPKKKTFYRKHCKN